MNICVFDTETTSLEKPFVYNIGYLITNTDTWETLLRRDFVVEQIWHNNELFATAYYAEKRPIYIEAMRKRLTIMDKFGYITQQMMRDFKSFNVENAFAFNSDFDEKVFNFNCDWFKCINPFDNVIIKDIRAFAHEFLTDDEYIEFCEQNELFTDSGNYSTTAETYFQFLTQDMEFSEKHTALADSEIEAVILKNCVEQGANLLDNYTAKRSIERKQEKELVIKRGREEIARFKCFGYTCYKSKNIVSLKGGE